MKIFNIISNSFVKPAQNCFQSWKGVFQSVYIVMSVQYLGPQQDNSTTTDQICITSTVDIHPKQNKNTHYDGGSHQL